MTKKEKWELLDIIALLIGSVPVLAIFIYMYKYHYDTFDIFLILKYFVFISGGLAIGLRKIKNSFFKEKDTQLAYIIEHLICWLMSFLIAGILCFLIWQ